MTKKTKPKRLSKEQFDLSMELSPRMVIEIIIKDTDGAIYLLMRENDPYKGNWHLPGGFLLKDEYIEECIARLLKDEADINTEIPYSFKGIHETLVGDPRGHILHYVIGLQYDDSPSIKGVSEYHTKLPKKIIPYQKKLLD